MSSFTDFIIGSFPTTPPSPVTLYVAVFALYDGGAPMLTFLQLDDNEAALDSLDAIAAANNDPDFTGRVFIDHPLSPEQVDALSSAASPDDLRALLSDALPDGPNGDGWADVDAWTVDEIEQRTLTGQLATLPLEPPPTLPEEWNNYAATLFLFHLTDFVR